MSSKKQYLKKIEKRSLVRNRTQISVACTSLTAKSTNAVSHGYMVNCRTYRLHNLGPLY